jgi:hypothetical protein
LKGTPILREAGDGRGVRVRRYIRRLAAVEAATGDHRVADVILESVTFVEYRSDTALRPGGGAAIEPALGQHHDAAALGQHERGGQPARPSR